MTRIGLIALMAIGSAMMWIGLPIALVYGASKMSDSTQPTLGPIMLVILGLPIGMTVIGKGLAKLDRRYGEVTGTLEATPRQPVWLRSMRGERTPQRRRSVLDTVMVVSVTCCLVLLGIWFFFFAGSSLPGA